MVGFVIGQSFEFGSSRPGSVPTVYGKGEISRETHGAVPGRYSKMKSDVALEMFEHFGTALGERHAHFCQYALSGAAVFAQQRQQQVFA